VGSERAGRERVAGVEVAALEAAPEPGDALLRAAVRERLGRHRALGLALDAVVADRGRRAEALLHVALLEQLARAVRVVRPHAGQAVRLQLEAHRELVALRLRHAPAMLL